MPPHPSKPVYANYPAEKLTIGAGVAIFHLATERVVVCRHARDGYWFLPKGRRNANEDTGRAAEREGFEESGYRNRLLPLPVKHRQPPDPDEGRVPFVAEPLWTQLLPLSETSQYLLFWYAAETVTAEIERSYGSEPGGSASGVESGVYRAPPVFPVGLMLKRRVEEDEAVDGRGNRVLYEPVRHEGTGVDEEEAWYESYLLSISEARSKLRGSVMEDVVRRGWEGVKLRMQMEDLGS